MNPVLKDLRVTEPFVPVEAEREDVGLRVVEDGVLPELACRLRGRVEKR